MIFILTVCHSETAPDTINTAFGQQILFIFPINKNKFRCISHTLESLPGQLHINACHITIGIHKTKG